MYLLYFSLPLSASLTLPNFQCFGFLKEIQNSAVRCSDTWDSLWGTDLPAHCCTLDKAASVPRQGREEPRSVLGCFGNTRGNSAIPILWPLTLWNRRKCKIHIEMGQGNARGQNALWGAWIVNSVMCPPRGSGRINNLTVSLKELGKFHQPLRAVFY